MVQRLRICLLMQGTLVQSLVWEDNTCHGATKTVRHSHGACVLHLLKRLLQPERPEATETRSPRATVRE